MTCYSLAVTVEHFSQSLMFNFVTIEACMPSVKKLRALPYNATMNLLTHVLCIQVYALRDVIHSLGLLMS